MNRNIEEEGDAEEVDPFHADDDDDDDDDAPENDAAGRLFGDLEELAQQPGAADVPGEQVIDGGMAEPSDESAPLERKRSRDGDLVCGASVSFPSNMHVLQSRAMPRRSHYA
jgi:hypothetical protein